MVNRLKMISVDHYFCPHQTLKNAENFFRKHFTPTQTAHKKTKKKKKRKRKEKERKKNKIHKQFPKTGLVTSKYNREKSLPKNALKPC
jgi:hypothetical protein